jgi:hypothetical protein
VFNEPVNTANIQDNQVLVDTNTTAVLTVNFITVVNSRTVILDTEPLDPTHGYSISLDFLEDICGGPNGNVMPYTVFPVYSYHSVPLPLAASWKFLDNDIDPAANWAQPGFNDSAWSTGTGPFDAKRQTPPPNCRPGGTMTNYFWDGAGPAGVTTFPFSCVLLTSPVTGTNLITAYFRAHFTYTGDTNGTILSLSGKFDDGGVVYLNGVEIWRVRMGTTNITDASLAAGTVGDADGRDRTILISSTNLHQGDNLIAVEMHQVNLTSTDSTMGLEINADSSSPIPVQPKLLIERSGTTATITWSGGGTLHRTTSLNTPITWVPITGSASPFVTNTTAAANMFFEIRP